MSHIIIEIFEPEHFQQFQVVVCQQYHAAVDDGLLSCYISFFHTFLLFFLSTAYICVWEYTVWWVFGVDEKKR